MSGKCRSCGQCQGDYAVFKFDTEYHHIGDICDDCVNHAPLGDDVVLVACRETVVTWVVNVSDPLGVWPEFEPEEYPSFDEANARLNDVVKEMPPTCLAEIVPVVTMGNDIPEEDYHEQG
jgi:hypothetical protein